MKKPFLICIDSDGCVFDTMEIKHKECFCPSYIQHFSLQPISKYAREAWEFVNLYSRYRGIHRLLALLKCLELLSNRKEVTERGFAVPQLEELRSYVAAGGALHHDGLQAYLKEHPESEEIRTVLRWSHDVNDRIGEMVHHVPPFPNVRACLKKMASIADVVIVSATQQLALEREWGEHGLTQEVDAICGQESGSKREIIAARKGGYAEGHVLMIGDAPGDLEAAKANGALFYPICPDKEAQSWFDFLHVLDRLPEGGYGAEAQSEAIRHFEKLLPQEANWR